LALVSPLVASALVVSASVVSALVSPLVASASVVSALA
jgi:hypothetical protein